MLLVGCNHVTQQKNMASHNNNNNRLVAAVLHCHPKSLCPTMDHHCHHHHHHRHRNSPPITITTISTFIITVTSLDPNASRSLDVRCYTSRPQKTLFGVSCRENIVFFRDSVLIFPFVPRTSVIESLSEKSPGAQRKQKALGHVGKIQKIMKDKCRP